MRTLERLQGDVSATLAHLAKTSLAGGAEAFLQRPSDDFGGITPLEFAVDVPTMQFAVRKFPPPPGTSGRRRLW